MLLRTNALALITSDIVAEINLRVDVSADGRHVKLTIDDCPVLNVTILNGVPVTLTDHRLKPVAQGDDVHEIAKMIQRLGGQE